MCSCFCTKTRGICHKLDGEVIFFQNLIVVNICYGYFCSGNKEVINALKFEKFLLELWQLAGPCHGITIDHEGGEYLGVSMFSRVQVEHEID